MFSSATPRSGLIIRWLPELVAAGRTWPDVGPPSLALEALDQEAKNGGLAGILEPSGHLVRRPRRAPEIGRNVDEKDPNSSRISELVGCGSKSYWVTQSLSNSHWII